MYSPRIETERLILRRMEEKDLDALYDIITDSRLCKYIKFPNLTRDEELMYIKKTMAEADTSKNENWVIELKDTLEVVGTISVNTVNKKHNYCNVGYAVRYNYWNNGYATEALNVVTNFLLNERRYHLIECSCNELNAQSIKVMEKAGYVKDGYIANRRLCDDNTYAGVVFYSKSM